MLVSQSPVMNGMSSRLSPTESGVRNRMMLIAVPRNHDHAVVKDGL